MRRLHTELIQKMREMQTEVLRGSYRWARPVDYVNTPLGVLEERVTAARKTQFRALGRRDRKDRFDLTLQANS